MDPVINAVILALCIAGLFVVLINIAMKFVGFIGRAIANESCKVSIAGELVFVFIFSFLIAYCALFPY